MSNQDRSPFTRLVLVILCLALAASVCAGFFSVVVGQHQMNELQAPENEVSPCMKNCLAKMVICEEKCNTHVTICMDTHCDTGYNDCISKC